MSKRHAVIIAMGLLASASALAQTETTGQAGPKPATPSGTVPAAANPAHAAVPKSRHCGTGFDRREPLGRSPRADA